MAVKLIAVDLDGTLLNSNKTISDFTRRTLEEACDAGISVMIATGRPFCALPEAVTSVRGIRYALTSNGANVVDLRTGESIYTNYIAPDAVDRIIEALKKLDLLIEIFPGGKAYYDDEFYRRLPELGYTEGRVQYILRTREHIPDMFDFFVECRERIENVNVNFSDQETRSRVRRELSKLEGITLTSSFDHNLELGGATTSKADAIRHMCGILGCDISEVMAAGDNPNDAAMLRAAGFGVAVGNAKQELIHMADFVSPDNDSDGVAHAIRLFALDGR
jgi:Cof subfamily protein (haloacid dehalogenase superfamily)